jgi:DNA-binding GntR family transcriptional regulator
MKMRQLGSACGQTPAPHIGRNAPLLSWTSVNADADSRPVNLDESVFAASRVDILLDYQ